MEKILITGKNSYIGTSLIKWLEDKKEDFYIEELDVKGERWKEYDFSSFDTVFHVAGIAHVSTDPNMEDLYYKVNRDLTIEVAKKAKNDGVGQFIFMSSMIVYGNESISEDGRITFETEPKPDNFYGQSKLEAEEGLKELLGKQFKIAIIRPPMIYGKNSKGNYPKLAKLAKYSPIFPNVENKRSMLHIDNLTELLYLIILKKDSGVFFPQNPKYIKTSELVKSISKVHGKKIWMPKFLNPIISKMSKNKIVNKVFGNYVYDQNMSNYSNNNYQIRTLKKSIELTESED